MVTSNYMRELVDVVDNNDHVISVVERLEAHQRRLVHRIVAVLAFDQVGRLIIQVRKTNGLYDHSVGGHVDSAETYSEAATREAQEELGLYCALTYVDTIDVVERSGVPHRIGLFTCRTDPGWVFVANDEVDRIIPVSVEAASLLIAQEPYLFTSGFIASFSRWKVSNESGR